MSDRHTITVRVNGAEHHVTVEARTHLADMLRHQIGLTGTHIGCEHGVCGACTVLLDGATVRSCLLLAAQADGHTVETIEGVAKSDEDLHPIQVALAKHHGLQCGYCTPGVVMTLVELQRDLEGQPVDEATVRHALAGNLCRCTGYQGMVDAALAVLNEQRK
ncbi:MULTISPECIES: (2Fe-2S)-binding protein [unclassified Beijerinckia]|uniref:(2Fe-2S)-binding protein n=1 Tax=unclassified Beijerinckia TaxID=2638183 RepID=UPI0008982F7C|nr:MULTISPECIES: (2Fe-2S)-binding protein [unclassified Beijerinckia]MDH7799160.1 aerobic-type carbon monoxide dehydrogenase small subunit (CoxS/CutS family) [Beijerinckia sp. GAS462]SED93276.1 carbon-monoxide dehydrogenase small subunit [Beijerinckia sp. 28-YEA-48]